MTKKKSTKRKQFDVGRKYLLAKVPESLAVIRDRIAEVTAMSKKDITLQVRYGGLLVMSFSELKKKTFVLKALKKTKLVVTDTVGSMTPGGEIPEMMFNVERTLQLDQQIRDDQLSLDQMLDHLIELPSLSSSVLGYVNRHKIILTDEQMQKLINSVRLYERRESMVDLILTHLYKRQHEFKEAAQSN